MSLLHENDDRRLTAMNQTSNPTFDQPITFGKPFSVEGHLSVSDVKDAIRLSAPSGRLFNILLLTFASFVLLGLCVEFYREMQLQPWGDFFKTFEAMHWFRIGVVGYGGLHAFILWNANRKAYVLHQQKRGIYANRALNFDDDGVSSISDEEEHRWAWNLFSKSKVNHEFLLLYFQDGVSVVVIPKAWFANEDDWSRLLSFVNDLFLNPFRNPEVAQEYRRRLQSKERALRQMTLVLAGLYFLAAVFPMGIQAGSAWPIVQWALLGSMSLFLLGCGFQALRVYWSIRNMSTWARRPLIALSTIALFMFPVGTIVSAVIFSSLSNKDGPSLLTPEHEFIISQTKRTS